MAQEIERVFKLTDDAMLERALVFHDRLALELADFTARFPWLDATWLTAFQNDITAADAFPTDMSVTLDIKVLTGDVKGAMQQGYAALQTLGGYAKLAFPTDVSRQRVFGQQNWSAAYNSTNKLQECLELAHEKADSAVLKAALLAKGYTQADIDGLNTLASELHTKNRLQEAAKAGRKVTKHDRISLLNVVWDHMRTVNICADVVWANDAERKGQYQLYPSTGGGSGGDNPPASKFIVTGTVTDMMSGNPIEGATVTLSAIDLEVTDMTGPDGSYEVGVEDVSAPMAGNITASADGYTPQSRGVNIEPDVLATENFSLDILPPPPPPPGP